MSVCLSVLGCRKDGAGGAELLRCTDSLHVCQMSEMQVEQVKACHRRKGAIPLQTSGACCCLLLSY